MRSRFCGCVGNDCSRSTNGVGVRVTIDWQATGRLTFRNYSGMIYEPHPLSIRMQCYVYSGKRGWKRVQTWSKSKNSPTAMQIDEFIIMFPNSTWAGVEHSNSKRTILNNFASNSATSMGLIVFLLSMNDKYDIWNILEQKIALILRKNANFITGSKRISCRL